jgi:hypothetical protein
MSGRTLRLFSIDDVEMTGEIVETLEAETVDVSGRMQCTWM